MAVRYYADAHHRRSIRLKGCDYAQPGAYFVTICTKHRECVLGNVAGGRIALTRIGEIVRRCWCELPRRFPHLDLDAFVIMPNHLRGIVVLTGRGEASAVVPHAAMCPEAEASPLRRACGTRPDSLASAIQAFKASSTRRVNRVDGTPGASLWQRNYYEHIVRSEKSLDAIRRYVEANPANWSSDPDNPANLPAEDQEETP